ncbi:MAG: radical SAM family heme chaperone HemW [Gammaproteobacteria bacterium]|nr:radical SAM family heme chaperone HemW [Gammaproteobacteria bacterium]
MDRLALYIHIPWCVRKCPYCDFNSHERRDALPETAYIDSLMRDLQHERDLAGDRSVSSVFFGGGTPSLFSAEAIGRILTEARQIFRFSLDCEITLEANPGTFEADKFAGFRKAGVNRLSIGVQSFDSHQLTQLGRIHNADEAKRAIQSAREVGFDNINIDIMHGLANQSVEEALDDLRSAIRFNPEHLSWYQLTIEPNTVFYKKPPTLPDIDALSDIEEAGFKLLRESGYHQYEVSAWSKSGRESQHNLSYWYFADYIGIGAGAHGKLTHNGIAERHRKTRKPEDYLRDSVESAKRWVVTNDDLVFEYFLNRLRLFTPIFFNEFEAATQLSFEVCRDTCVALESRGLIKLGRDCFELTSVGRRFLNDVQSAFLRD